MIQAICWVLIHSLWQGVLLSLAGGGVILCTKRSPAAVRYRLLCGLFGLFVAGMAATFFYEWGPVSRIGSSDSTPGMSMNWLTGWCSTHAYSIVVIWMMVAVVKSVRMATGWSYIWRMRREGSAAPSLWVEKVTALSEKLGIRRTVKLVESGLVKVPVVIGQLRPIMYVPLGLINHLPPGEMEAVLLHELAHVRRYDYVVNMLQQAAECVLFFNPGFLWVSYLIREERENCCDDAAIGCTQNRVEFVRALVRFKEHSLRGAALAFPGNRRQLLHRVLRISRRENKTLSGRERLILLGGCVLLLCMFAVRVERVAGKPAALQAVQPVSPELVKVLQTRQQVAQNMEWVQGQLEQLHHQPTGHQRDKVKNRPKETNKAEVPIGEEDQVTATEQTTAMEQTSAAEQIKAMEPARPDQQAEQDRKQAMRDREQAERDRQQAERDRQQADQDREQAERDRQQAMRDREQAIRDRAQADLNRQQAERDREQVVRDRQSAEMERAKMELQRKQAEPDRQKHKVIDLHQ